MSNDNLSTMNLFVVLYTIKHNLQRACSYFVFNFLTYKYTQNTLNNV